MRFALLTVMRFALLTVRVAFTFPRVSPRVFRLLAVCDINFGQCRHHNT